MQIHTDYGPPTERELELRADLRLLEARYRAEAQPILDELTKIHSHKVPRIFVTPDEIVATEIVARS